jgi:hypothetical protein
MAPRPSRPPTLVLLAAAALALAGCQDEPITRYTAPHEPGSVPRGRGQRVLAAAVKQGDRAWFFKLVGPADAVARHRAEFDDFLAAVTFSETNKERPVSWQRLPDGWRKVESKERLRYATFRLGPDEAPLEASVVMLPGGGSDLDNVNRWRRNDLGLPNIAEEDLAKNTRPVKVGGLAGILADMDNPLGVSFKAPDGWEPGGNVPFSHAVFVVPAPTSWWTNRRQPAVRVSVSGLPRQKLVENADRWSQQVGLGPVTSPEDVKGLSRLRVADEDRDYLDLAGPAQRVLAVLVNRDADDGVVTWVFTMRGPADVVGKNKEAFEAFVRSAQFNDGGGDDGQ